jgi:hypothetical protein
MNRFILALGSSLMLFAACTKGEDPVSIEEDLRSGVWRRTSAKMTYKDPATGGDSTLDYLALQPDCRKDNAMEFKENFDGQMDLGTKECTSGEPQTKKFTWQVVGDGQKLLLYGVEDYFPQNDITADIVSRTLGYMTIRYKVINMDPQFQTGDTVIFTDVLRK